MKLVLVSGLSVWDAAAVTGAVWLRHLPERCSGGAAVAAAAWRPQEPGDSKE